MLIFLEQISRRLISLRTSRSSMSRPLLCTARTTRSFPSRIRLRNRLGSSKGQNFLSLGATVPVPSQSPIPFQSFLYVWFGSAGISAGFLPDLQYSLHSFWLFKSSLCTNSFALKNAKWAGSDSNQRPPPCQGGILTRLDHRPFILIFIFTLWPTYIFAD